MEVDLVDGAGVAGQFVEDASGCGVPDVDVSVPATGPDLTAVSAPRTLQQVLKTGTFVSNNLKNENTPVRE